jgi:ribosome recycling factor
MIEDIKKDAEQRMQKSIASLTETLGKMRTGRASPGILEGVMVPYYGTDTPLSQVASINVADSRTLTVTPWEDGITAAVEKAIMTADLGLNPSSAGKTIRVPMPALTEETRKGFVKKVRDEAEQGRVAVRNIRRDANGDFKDLLKEKEISEDEARNAEDAIQKITNQYIAQADKLLATKEAALMEI